jgi:hypothetical protein
VHVIYRKADREIVGVAAPPQRAFVMIRRLVDRDGGGEDDYGVLDVPRRVWRMRGRRTARIDEDGRLRFED